VWFLVCVGCLYGYCSTSNVLFVIQFTYYGWPLTKGLILLAKNNIVMVEFQSKVGMKFVGVAYWIENLQSIGVELDCGNKSAWQLGSLRSGIEQHKAYPYFFGQKWIHIGFLFK